MQGQILHLLQRRMAGQIGGTGADDGVAGAEAARHQVGIQIVGDAHREIDPLLHQVDGSVQQQDVDGRSRVLRQIVVGSPDQQRFGEGVAAGDAQLPLGGLVTADGQMLHLFPQRQHGAGPVQCLLPRPGQAQTAGGAVQQSGPHPTLQLGQIARDHGAGHLQFLPGAAQAALFDHADEDPQCGQSIHLWLSICSICATVMCFLCCICTLGDPIHCVHQMNPEYLMRNR
ncbi:hypothetical protein D3C76_805650 [compost metagenome]